MEASLAIGDFSRATHLSVKTLRHYHQVGLLEPVDVDPKTGHRRYSTGQIPTAQVIRRLRSLEMPVEKVRAVIEANDVTTRNELIGEHLSQLEDTLVRTQDAVASLRGLLEPAGPASTVINHRTVEPAPAAAIHEVIDLEDASSWYQGAFGELFATLAAQHIVPSGPSGGIYANDLFAYERGAATVFVPCAGQVKPTGRVESLTVPGAELALIVHSGAHSEIDRAYGAIAAYVTDHALAVEGPIREYYLVGSHDTPVESLWRTEIGWPIFRVAQSP
ncbi:MAG: MerR family transcriptional regulator [Acidimicrobiales bacterium]